jgi:hypothetical protein
MQHAAVACCNAKETQHQISGIEGECARRSRFGVGSICCFAPIPVNNRDVAGCVAVMNSGGFSAAPFPFRSMHDVPFCWVPFSASCAECSVLYLVFVFSLFYGCVLCSV